MSTDLDTAALRDELMKARVALVAAITRCREANDCPEPLAEAVREASTATYYALTVPVFSFVDWLKAHADASDDDEVTP